MLLPSPLLKYVNNNDVRALIEAWWMEHWMDHMLGVGHNKDQDGLGLLSTAAALCTDGGLVVGDHLEPIKVL